MHEDRYRALWDEQAMWWAVSDGRGCYANGLTESEARALAAELTERDREKVYDNA